MRMKAWYVLLFLIATALILALSPCATQATQKEGSAPPTQQSATTAPAAEPAVSAKVNINTANAAELEKLPGIGAKIAEEIVKHRDAHGPFKSTDELKTVKGVGDKKYEALKDKITTE